MTQAAVAFIALAVIALPLIAYAAVMLQRLRAWRHWQPTRGVVVRSWLVDTEVPGTDSLPAWQVRVVYERTGSVLSPDPGAYRFTSHRKALRYLARWPAGAEVTVHVASDGRVALTTRVDWERMSHFLAAGLGGLIVLGFGGFLFWTVR
jgi:hypothetical protein